MSLTAATEVLKDLIELERRASAEEPLSRVFHDCAAPARLCGHDPLTRFLHRGGWGASREELERHLLDAQEFQIAHLAASVERQLGGLRQ